MNPLVAPVILEVLKLGTDLWRQHANKPADWVPTEADWEELRALAGKTAADYKAEAAKAAPAN
ncbi:MAG: hypothetical protein FD161_2994 [Limisphaerales bacterium]|nr:MAG: hypothetical protein FD161_2994 [Limisphaerales bacterium]KAG0508107.1 MAG: hypothetical protein E1N63_2701 [Limisphaerales bacterium]TXT53040.1 MAG: hypothetical protein FD140_148 [Limisphaerales bacterium]